MIGSVSTNLLSALLLICLMTNVSASSSTTKNPPSWFTTTTTVDFHKQRIARTLRSWRIRSRHGTTRRRSIIEEDDQKESPSILTWKHPNANRIAQWFGAEEDEQDQLLIRRRRSLLKQDFNHGTRRIMRTTAISSADGYCSIQK